MKRPRRRARRVIGWIVVSAVAGAALWGAWQGVCGRAGLCGWDAIELVEVRGTVRLDAGQVRAWAAVPFGAPLWATDGDDIVARLDGRPWIKSATVTKRFPDTVIIEVTERVPTAVAETNRGRMLVDADGSVIGPTALGQGFPVIVGASASRPDRLRIAVGILAGFRAADVSAAPLGSLVIDVTNPDDPVAQLPGLMRVRLGRGDFAEKWRRVQAIYDNTAARIPRPRVVDLRFSDRAVVTAWDGAL
jgi:cell division protein FtsQ